MKRNTINTKKHLTTTTRDKKRRDTRNYTGKVQYYKDYIQKVKKKTHFTPYNIYRIEFIHKHIHKE